MPAALKIILNIFFFLIYIVVFSLLAGIIYNMIQWGTADLWDEQFFIRFQIIMGFIILFITVLLKKYFYISLAEKEEIIVIED